MTSTTQGRTRGQEPPLHQIRSWQDAEINAATWMRHWGLSDAAVTNGGADGGIDVRSTRALAQVKYLAAAVGRPDLQRLAGAGAGEPGKQLFFFSGSDYTATALEYADLTGIALFTYGLDGSMSPVNAAARQAAQLRPSSGLAGRATGEPADWKERWKAGGWYLGVPILSAGIFAAVPFWHASSRLNRPELRASATAYSVAGAAILAIYGITPKDAQGDPVGTLGSILQTVAVVAGLIVIITACVKLSKLRREIFSRPSWESPLADPREDPLQQARARRDARSLMAEDPTMARSLGIGRPDLGRGYDDGGLIDLNTAPAPVIAQVCDGLDAALAEAIVAARFRQGGVFYNVDELLIAVRMPPSVEGELRERAVF